MHLLQRYLWNNGDLNAGFIQKNYIFLEEERLMVGYKTKNWDKDVIVMSNFSDPGICENISFVGQF